jgi:succinate dehydrogenase/fumarate reductase-like Fe-S protein
MIRRSPPEGLLKPETRAKMRKVEDCLHCDACSAKCPYGLDTPRLLEKNYSDYREILAGKPL